MARDCHFERRVPSGRQKSFGPAPAEMMRELERENRSNLHPRAGERFLPPRGHPALEMTNTGQLRFSYLNKYLVQVVI